MIALVVALALAGGAMAQGPKAADIAWLRQNTINMLNGCQLQGVNDTMIFTPDATHAYGAQWTRDFYYALSGAGDLFFNLTGTPSNLDFVRKAVQYTLAGVREDGCFPDRVQTDGLGVYSPGNNWVDHADDNGPFGALLVAQYAALADDRDFFCASEPMARAGLEFLNRSSFGLIYNSPIAPNCTYGFTDTVAKTGHELFTSLLYFQACTVLADLTARWGCGDTAEYTRQADLIRANLDTLLLDSATGLYYAGEIDCRQHDVWGSVFAVYLNLTTPEHGQQIVNFMINNKDRIFQRGQLRHLVSPELWQRCIEGACPTPGTYQNGAYWATPLQWFLPTLAAYNTTAGAALAAEYLQATIADFQTNGTAECVNNNYHGVMDYVASATAVWSAAKALGYVH